MFVFVHLVIYLPFDAAETPVLLTVLAIDLTLASLIRYMVLSRAHAMASVMRVCVKGCE